MVSAPVRREQVRYMAGKGLSERRALRVVGMSASALRYTPRPDRNVELRAQILGLAHRHKRYGVGMIYLKLRQGGHAVNYKRVERLYQQAKLQVRRRKRKKVPVAERQPLIRPVAANEVWSMDFIFDRTADGRAIKCLVIVDDASHEAVAIEVERAISGHGVSRVLDRLALSRGLPKVIRTDNGKEFCGKAGNGRLGARTRCDAASDPAGKAESECLCRIVQRSPARRMPQRALVPDVATCPRRDRALAQGIQRGQTQEKHRRTDARRLCETTRGKVATMSPDSKQSRY